MKLRKLAFMLLPYLLAGYGLVAACFYFFLINYCVHGPVHDSIKRASLKAAVLWPKTVVELVRDYWK